MPLASLDTESYYDKDVSITTLGTYHYLRHPLCNIYLLTVACDNGFEYAGSLEDAPWEKFSGPEWEWVHHNAAHEDEVFRAAKEKRQMPDVKPGRVHCTADMSAYLGAPRALAGACEQLLGVKVSKETRDKMKGRKWEQMSDDFRKEVVDYGMADARRTLELWQKHSDRFPEFERQLSELTRKMSFTGVCVDVELVDQYLGHLKRLIWESTRQIPWSDTHPALSAKQLSLKCREVGIDPPASLAMDSDDCAAWEEKHGDKYPWVAAMRQRRRANTLLKRFETLRGRVRPDGRASLPLKYAGAHTRRWSGDAGFNAQSMSRDELLGTEVRKCIIAPPGRKLVAADLSQIEPRVLAVLSGDTSTLEMLQKYDIYEAHARATMGFDKPETLKSLAHIPEFERMRRLAKARVLGLGYGCGPDKFVLVAKILAGLELTAAEAQKTVKEFRESNPKIVRLWRKMQRALEQSVGGDLTVKLPSGNVMTYKSIACRDGDYTAMMCRNGRMMRVKTYGAAIVENLTQHVARDVFATGLLKLAATYTLILQTHDEAVLEVPLEVDKQDIVNLMTVAPSWMPTLPLAAEAVEGPHYAI